jgi:hypothetical protein
MKRTSLLWAFGLVTLLMLANWSPCQERVAAPKNTDPIEVQTRGPVHDAIAQPFGVKPAPGPLVAKEPPALIREEPPEQKPDLANSQWIPGYWAWDAQRQEYIWVSGVYRVSPQDRSYVPGYWASTADGWRWVAGFWSSGKLQDNAYTPEPPATLDNGPALAPPEDNSLYVPGTWVWQQDRFTWRPGYWAASQDDRVWVSPHYLWTPNGYVYVDGYWDYPMENRGMMFAPVAFNQPLSNDPNWTYQPNYVVGFNNFLDSAFVNGPGFYFGNYYNPRDARAGFNPWYTGNGRYDPAFATYSRQNPLASVQQTYAGRSAGQIAAPPLTFAQQGLIGGFSFVSPLNQFGGKQMRLVNTTAAQLATQRTGIQQSRQLAVTRQQFEAGGKSANSQRVTTALRTYSGPQIINGKAGSNGVTQSAGTLPKIINEPRSYTPSTSGPKIVNAAPATIRGTITAAPAHVSPPVRTFNATPARTVAAPRPAAARPVAGHKR